MKIAELFTVDVANEGVRVEPVDKLGNPIKGHWLLVRGIDSDAYRAAHDTLNREVARLAAAVRARADAPLLAATQAEKEAAALAERVALVAAWSFEDECTAGNIELLFRKAPLNSDRVFYTAMDRDRFFGNNSATSTAGPSTNLDSENQQQPEAPKP